jgi:hypothetical protein
MVCGRADRDLACTYAFTHVVKPQWEATAWIQIGQVGQVPRDQDPKVEPLAAGYRASAIGAVRKRHHEKRGLSPTRPRPSSIARV